MGQERDVTGQINIHWRGPHSYEDVRGMDGEADRGLYQIYGTHPVYGAGTLLYIGRTWENTFRERFSDHEKLGKLADLQWESNSFQWRIHTDGFTFRKPTLAQVKRR